MTSIYLGNLSWDLDEEALRAAIEETAVPTTVEIKRNKYNKSLGYALASFESPEDADAVITALHGAELDGREVNCREDRGPRSKPAASSSGSGSGSGYSAAASNSVFIGNLSWDTTDDVLLDEFSEFNVTSATVQLQSNGNSKGWAIAQFATEEDAAAAIDAMNGTELDGRDIICRPDRGSGGRNSQAKAKRAPRQPRRRERRVLEDGQPSPSVFIGNLNWEVNDDGLTELLKDYNYSDASVQTRPDGKSRGYALVEFVDVDEAQRAIQDLNGQVLMSRDLIVKFDAKQ